MKTENFTIILEHFENDIAFGSLYWNNVNREVIVYFNMKFDIDLRSFDGRSQFDRIDIDFEWFEIDLGAEQKQFQINERNLKMLKEKCVDIINDTPESFGVDFEDEDLNWDDDEPTIWSTMYAGYPSRINANNF